MAPRIYRSNEVQAFTMPDGRILVSSGLFDRDVPDETLAFILAHEIAHHELGHFRALNTWDGKVGPTISEIAFVFRRAVHAHGDELAADARAFERIRAAGYDATGAIALVRSLPERRREPRTHPSNARRIQQLEVLCEAAAREGGARPSPTFRTRFCVVCRLRHAESHCPECGARSHDLTIAAERKDARRAMEQRYGAPDTGQPIVRGGALVAATLVGTALAPTALVPAVIFVGSVLLAHWAESGGLRRVGRQLRRMRSPRIYTTPVRLAPIPRERRHPTKVGRASGATSVGRASGATSVGRAFGATSVGRAFGATNVGRAFGATSVTGIAKTDRPLIAPLSRRPCIAWRLEGVGRYGPIHDAAFTAFRVVDRARGEVEVPPQRALITFSATKIRTPMESRTIPWLETRVIDARGVDLIETIIAVGDVVQVSGPARRTFEGGAYRSAQHERIEWLPDGVLEIVS